MPANNVLGLNGDLWKIWGIWNVQTGDYWGICANQKKFTKEYVIYTAKHVLAREKEITNGLHMGKKSMKWKYIDYSAAVVSQEGHTDIFLWHERTHHWIYLKKLKQ